MRSSEFFKKCNSMMQDMAQITAFGGNTEKEDEKVESDGQDRSTSGKYIDDWDGGALFIDSSYTEAAAVQEDAVQEEEESLDFFESFLEGSETEAVCPLGEQEAELAVEQRAEPEKESADTAADTGSYVIYPGFDLAGYRCPLPCVSADGSLAAGLLRRLKDDLYVVKEGMPLQEVYNLNFLDTADSEEEALQRLILMYYEVAVSMEVLHGALELLTEDLLSKLSGFGRELALSDLRIFHRLSENSRTFVFFKTYAYTAEIALLMQQTLEAGKLDTEELLLYTGNADFLKVYLHSVLDNSYSRETLRPMLAADGSGIDFSKLDRRILRYVPLVEGRQDRDILFDALTALADRGADFQYDDLLPYRESPYLKEIIDSWGREWFSRQYVDRYLKGPCSGFVVEYYASGKLNPSTFQKMGHDVYLTAIVTDMMEAGVSERTLLGISFGSRGSEVKKSLESFVEAYHGGMFTRGSYRQALYVFGMEKLCQPFLDLLNRESPMQSFNSAIYGMAAEALGCTLPLEGIDAKTIGSAVLFMLEDSSVKACTAENLLFDFESLKGMHGRYIIRILNNNAGICVLGENAEFDDRLLKYSVLSSGSLDVWGSLNRTDGIDTFGQDIKLYCNTILFLNEHAEVADTVLAKTLLFGGGNAARILKERLFYRLRSDLSWAWGFLLCAHASEWFHLLVESCTCQRSGLFMYKVLSKALDDWCGGRLLCEKPVMRELPKGEGMIKLRGFPFSFSEIAYHTFFTSLDGILPKLKTAGKVMLVQEGSLITISVE